MTVLCSIAYDSPRTPTDAKETALFLTAAGATFGGIHDRRAITWLCEWAAAGNSDVLVLAARDESRIVGAVLAVRRELALAIKIFRITPLFGTRVLLRLGVVACTVALSGEILRRPNWIMSFGRRALKVNFIATYPAARGRGIARMLYTMLRESAKERGDVKWVIARVAPTNTVSIALHKALGWHINTYVNQLSCWIDVA